MKRKPRLGSLILTDIGTVILLIVMFSGCSDPVTTVTIPEVTTADVTAVTDTTAQCGGNVTSDGGAPVTACGVCWSTAPDPTISDNKTVDGSGLGSFTSEITSLTAGNSYYVRAYATNSEGTGYGSAKPISRCPVVSTSNVTARTDTTAQCGGNVTSNGGEPVTARGVCWSTTDPPTTADNKTINGSGLGSFTSEITGLTAGNFYYVCAYATNNIGTCYGSVKAIPPVGLATVIITTIDEITPTTARCVCNVLSEGVAPVTARGVCWKIWTDDPNDLPTDLDSKTIDGSGLGSFTSEITGLTPKTCYKVRAYAENSFDIAYSEPEKICTPQEDQMIDCSGNRYDTVKIGIQVWTIENLKATNYCNVDRDTILYGGDDWGDLTTGAYCYYNDDTLKVDTYGCLYNWYAINDSRNIAPEGWHVATDADWQILVDYLEGVDYAGGKMKEKETQHWEYPNTGATNESGFLARPGGYRSKYGEYFGDIGVFPSSPGGHYGALGYLALFWADTESSSSTARYRELRYNATTVYNAETYKQGGLSVRCVKD